MFLTGGQENMMQNKHCTEIFKRTTTTSNATNLQKYMIIRKREKHLDEEVTHALLLKWCILWHS